MFVSVLLRNLCPSIILKRWASYLPRKKNYYEILGVHSNSTTADIRQAFVRLSNELHPDRNIHYLGSTERRTNNTRRFMEVKEAYDCLRNPEKRVAYDSELNLVNGSGYLKEVKSIRFNGATIIDLNRRRNDAYEITNLKSCKNSAVKTHFRNPEEDYYQEKRKNRMLLYLAGLLGCLTLGNIAYIWLLSS